MVNQSEYQHTGLYWSGEAENESVFIVCKYLIVRKIRS